MGDVDETSIRPAPDVEPSQPSRDQDADTHLRRRSVLPPTRPLRPPSGVMAATTRITSSIQPPPVSA
jgi:hypothetical protein